MKRKLLSLLLVLAMVFTLLPTAAFAADGVGIDLVQDGLRFRMENGGAYVVEMADKTLTDVRIPSQFADVCDVVGIDEGAFKGTDINSVIIPETVTEIGQEAFMNCKKLVNINFQGSDAYLGERAFKNCTRLVDLYVPATGILYDGTFAGCTSLTSITIGKNVKKIGKNAFTGCKKLKSIIIKTKKLTTKTVKKGAFNGISKKVVVKVPKSKYKTYKKLLPAKGLKKAAKIRK